MGARNYEPHVRTYGNIQGYDNIKKIWSHRQILSENDQVKIKKIRQSSIWIIFCFFLNYCWFLHLWTVLPFQNFEFGRFNVVVPKLEENIFQSGFHSRNIVIWEIIENNKKYLPSWVLLKMEVFLHQITHCIMIFIFLLNTYFSYLLNI